MWKIMIGNKTVAIYNDIFGPYSELVERPMHGQDAGAEYVYFVYFLGSYHTYGPSQRIVLYLHAQFISLVRRKLFGIV